MTPNAASGDQPHEITSLQMVPPVEFFVHVHSSFTVHPGGTAGQPAPVFCAGSAAAPATTVMALNMTSRSFWLFTVLLRMGSGRVGRMLRM